MRKSKHTPISYASIVAIVVCILLKAATCSVSLDGSVVTMSMTSDYWNFGKELLGGKILYKDIIDHKGLYLYAMYAFMGLVSGNNIKAVVWFETLLYAITVGAFCTYIKKDTDMENIDKKNNSFLFLSTAIFSVAYLLSTYKTTIVNTEGLVAVTFLLLWGHIKEKPKITPRLFFVIGIVLGTLTNFKVTAILPCFPIFLYICTVHTKEEKDVKVLLKSVIAGIVGLLLSNVPFLIYLIKNKCLGEFVEINRFVLGKGGSIGVEKIVVLIALCLLIVVCLFKNNKKYAVFLVSMCALTIAIQFGSVYNYYIPMYTAILFTGIFYKRKVNMIVITLSVLLLTSPIVNNIKTDSFETKYIADKYGINNENILYLCEDYGFGVYDDKLYREPLQWIPAGMLYSDEFSKYYTNLTIERLKSQSFQYVFFATPEQIQNVLEMYEYKDHLKLSRNDEVTLAFYKDIANYLLENYECTEDLDYLYRAKNSS